MADRKTEDAKGKLMELNFCLRTTIERLVPALRVGLRSHQRTSSHHTNKALMVLTSLDTDTIIAGLPARLGFLMDSQITPTA